VASCNLDWCITLKIKAPNFGGWVRENYLALALKNRWFYSMFSMLKKDEKYTESYHLHTTWHLKELKGRLRSKGMSDNGLKSDLLVRVTEEKNYLPKKMYLGTKALPMYLLFCMSLVVMFGYQMKKFINQDHVVQENYQAI
jgi:hypothetical protein